MRGHALIRGRPNERTRSDQGTLSQDVQEPLLKGHPSCRETFYLIKDRFYCNNNIHKAIILALFGYTVYMYNGIATVESNIQGICELMQAKKFLFFSA